MNREQIIRAWKDEEYRSGLSESEFSSLPENPAGIVELSGADLGEVGGYTPGLITIITCANSCYLCISWATLYCLVDDATLDYQCR